MSECGLITKIATSLYNYMPFSASLFWWYELLFLLKPVQLGFTCYPLTARPFRPTRPTSLLAWPIPRSRCTGYLVQDHHLHVHIHLSCLAHSIQLGCLQFSWEGDYQYQGWQQEDSSNRACVVFSMHIAQQKKLVTCRRLGWSKLGRETVRRGCAGMDRVNPASIKSVNLHTTWNSRDFQSQKTWRQRCADRRKVKSASLNHIVNMHMETTRSES